MHFCFDNTHDALYDRVFQAKINVVDFRWPLAASQNVLLGRVDVQRKL